MSKVWKGTEERVTSAGFMIVFSATLDALFSRMQKTPNQVTVPNGILSYSRGHINLSFTMELRLKHERAYSSFREEIGK